MELLRCELFLVSRVNNELPTVSSSFTCRPHTLRPVEFQMNQPALARRHRIETKRLACFAHALRSHTRRKFQFFQPRRAIVPAIESHSIVKARVQPQPSMRHMFERQKKLRITLEKKILICSAKRNDDILLLRAAC